MWSSSSLPTMSTLMTTRLTVPIPMSTTSMPPVAAIFLSTYGFHDVTTHHCHMYSDSSSMSSITRVISCLLVITTAGLQLPNIFKILRSRNCEGVSILSTAILLHSSSANVAYCINQNLPLSTWAESVPLMAQYITLMCLLLLYQGRQRCMLLFVLFYVLLMLPLLLGLVPGHIVCTLKVLTLPLTLIGKVNEIYGTYKRGGTGQKSKKSIFLLNLRSGGRLLTSLFDTCDMVLVLCYTHACCWNTLITCQTVYYGHKRRRRLREERKRRENEEQAASSGGSSFESSSSDSDAVSDSDGVGVGGGVRMFRHRRRCNNVLPVNAGT